MSHKDRKNRGSALIPTPLIEHLEVFFEELPLSELPRFSLTSPEEAKAASIFYNELQKMIEQKIKQATALKSVLQSSSISENSTTVKKFDS